VKWGIAYMLDGGISHVQWHDTEEEAKAWAFLQCEEICCTDLREHLDDEAWLEKNGIWIYEADREAGWCLQWMDGGTIEWYLIPGPSDE